MKIFGKLILVPMVFLSFTCLSGCDQANQVVEQAGQAVEKAKEMIGIGEKPEDEGKNQETEPAEGEGKSEEAEPVEGEGKIEKK